MSVIYDRIDQIQQPQSASATTSANSCTYATIAANDPKTQMVDAPGKYISLGTTINSILCKAYDLASEEAGHSLRGHFCITQQDREEALHTGSDLLFGEILPLGVDKLLDHQHLHAAASESLVDLGMGIGKLAMQAFLQCPNLKNVVGVELSFSRTKEAISALERLNQMNTTHIWRLSGSNAAKRIVEIKKKASSSVSSSAVSTINNIDDEDDEDRDELEESESEQEEAKVKINKSEQRQKEKDKDKESKEEKPKKSLLSSTLSGTASSRKKNLSSKPEMNKANKCYIGSELRSLEFRRDDLFNVQDCFNYDIVILETHIPTDRHNQLIVYLNQFKNGCKMLTYEDIESIYRRSNQPFPFTRMKINDENDRFYTSWATARGHHFHLWVKEDSEATKKNLSSV